ncbi:hypothetical protein [Streptomyces sp. DH10]|uniref:hypothetical protein n=1 Tax=Streptomyces sp. DH10 TaxID=3040121 RepID=UPI002442A65F|nr:hypothetical protein [Streptomyces sp. DH10]MDG9711154.1 hypothetical protein [Streptomyces sp. DH10]
MDLLSYAGWIFGALAGIGALAAAVVKVKSNVDNATAEIWKGEAEAQKARADRLEVELGELSARVTRLEQERELLLSMATGQAAITELRSAMTAQFEEVKSLLTSTP